MCPNGSVWFSFWNANASLQFPNGGEFHFQVNFKKCNMSNEILRFCNIIVITFVFAMPARMLSPNNETEPNRDPVLQDQKVFPEVRNRPLLPMEYFSHSTFRNMGTYFEIYGSSIGV